jgi:hypothetical protein
MPRWMHGKCPKSSVTDSLRRPNLELAAVIVHGHGVFVFIGDEDLRTGGNFHAEILMRALDHVFKACSKNGKVWPADLSVHADNTVAAAKNITVSSLCACLTAGSYFRCCGHQHLRVGHSHEDVGACKKIHNYLACVELAHITKLRFAFREGPCSRQILIMGSRY